MNFNFKIGKNRLVLQYQLFASDTFEFELNLDYAIHVGKKLNTSVHLQF